MVSGSRMFERLFYVVAGGRNYDRYDQVKRVLDSEKSPGMVVVQGECSGADELAKRWCRETGVPCIGIEALWDFYGKGAGPIRNGWMFDLLPIYKLIAFPGGRGTSDAVQQALAREVLVRSEMIVVPASIARDSDGSPKGRDAKRLDGEAATARAEGIAQPTASPPPSEEQ